MIFVIILIVAGLILAFAEVALIPGFGIAGIAALLSMAGASYYSFHYIGTLAGTIVTIVEVVLLVAMTILLLRSNTWSRLALKTDINSKAKADADSVVTLGDEGESATRLAPSGTVRFGTKSVEARALEGMIDPGVAVRVVLIEDNKIYVKPIN